MRKLVLLALLLAPVTVLGIDLGPVKIDTSTRLLMANSPTYPVRLDEQLLIRVEDFWIQVLFTWDRAGLTTKVVSTDPLKTVEIPINSINNRLTTGYNVWTYKDGPFSLALAPVFQMQQFTGRPDAYRGGLGIATNWADFGFKIRNASRFMAGSAELTYRLDNVLIITHELGFRLVDVLTLDFDGTGPYTLNNKVTLGFEVVPHLSPVVQLQTISGAATVWRAGLEARF